MQSKTKHVDIDQIKITRGHRSTTLVPPQPDHFHRYYEVFYLLSGQCRFLLKDTIYSLEKGDLVLIAPGELHHSIYSPDIICDVVFIYFKEDFLLPNLFSSKDSVGPFVPKSFMGSVPTLYQEEFHSILAKMLSENLQIDELSPSFMTCQLNELLLLLTRHSVLTEKEPELINAKEAEIMLATKYIYKNFQKPLTLAEVARVSNLSPTYFSKKFKATTGMGFKEYLNYIRLKHASAALLTTSNTITDIALEYGFNDCNYFKDLFKKVYGKSPREFRKSQAN